jgi:hypothetical protein
MKSRIHAFKMPLWALLLAMASFAGAQTMPQAQKKSKMRPAEILAAVKPGQWVQMEGVVQKNFSALCTDVKILTGDIPEDKWSLEGFARSIDPDKQEFKVLLVPVKTQQNTAFKSKGNMAFKSFADVNPKQLLEVDGTYLKDGAFLAVEIEDKSEKLIAKPYLQNMVEFYGRVEKVDAASRTITVMGITFQLTDKTEGEWAVD